MEDDKHFINVGEPGLPLTSFTRGGRVMSHDQQHLIMISVEYTRLQV